MPSQATSTMIDPNSVRSRGIQAERNFGLQKGELTKILDFFEKTDPTTGEFCYEVAAVTAITNLIGQSSARAIFS